MRHARLTYGPETIYVIKITTKILTNNNVFPTIPKLLYLPLVLWAYAPKTIPAELKTNVPNQNGKFADEK